ncbi:MAG: hypothetical protein OXI33_16025, partial [Chloroflexota bacterium]|nr:hypothetical protein [Chloroflexota bacterium]
NYPRAEGSCSFGWQRRHRTAVGSVQVEIQDAHGRPQQGFSQADSSEQYGDKIDHRVSWTDGLDVSSFQGMPVRLRFVLKDADLYAFKFN